MTRKELEMAKRIAYNEIARTMVIEDIKDLAKLLLEHTATKEEIDEVKEYMALQDTEDNKFALVWDNVAHKGYLCDIPTITLRKADNMLIFYLLDDDPIVPNMVCHNELSLGDLRKIRDLMTSKLEETIIKGRVQLKMILEYGVISGVISQ